MPTRMAVPGLVSGEHSTLDAIARREASVTLCISLDTSFFSGALAQTSASFFWQPPALPGAADLAGTRGGSDA